MFIRYSALLLAAMPLVGAAEIHVAVVGESLQDARSRYASTTGLPRRDCDPAPGVGWVCASFDDPTLADVGVLAPVPDAAPVPTPAPMPAPASTPASLPPAIGAAVIGGSLDEARRAYARTTSQPRVDCDPVSGGRWVCASFADPTLADAGDAPQVAVPPTPAAAPAPAPAPAPTQPAQPTRLKLQAEDLPLGPGWRVESERAGAEGDAYAIWRGPNLFGSPGEGLTNLQFTVPSAGEYQLVIRARAVSPDRGDLSNDSWFRFPGGAWTKVFTTGRDDWQVGGTADRDDGQFPFRDRLEAGVTTVQMSGRSERHAIDWIALERVGDGG